jgi:hypothetical protein
MKSLVVLAFAMLPLFTTNAQDIVFAEYYFDADPGHGNGTAVTVTADTVVDLSFTADLTGLTKGLHTLYVRTLDDSGICTEHYGR